MSPREDFPDEHSGSTSPEDRTRLLAQVYDELRAIAHRVVRGANPADSLRGTALVHEALLKLLDDIGPDTDAHVFACKAARVMRTLAIDHWRARQTDRRGGRHQRISFSAIDVADEHSSEPDLIELDRALTTLAQQDPELARLVELRFFVGLTAEEAAKLEGVTTRTMERRWQIARTWLARAIRGTDVDSAP